MSLEKMKQLSPMNEKIDQMMDGEKLKPLSHQNSLPTSQQLSQTQVNELIQEIEKLVSQKLDHIQVTMKKENEKMVTDHLSYNNSNLISWQSTVEKTQKELKSKIEATMSSVDAKQEKIECWEKKQKAWRSYVLEKQEQELKKLEKSIKVKVTDWILWASVASFGGACVVAYILHFVQ